MTTGQQDVMRDGTTIEDVDAIAQTLQLYIDGTASGDRAKLAEAFHPDARMFGALGEQRFDVPITEYADVVAGTPADVAGTFRTRITSITQTGDAAARDNRRGGLLGDRLVRRPPDAVPHRGSLAHRQQDVRPYRRRASSEPALIAVRREAISNVD